MAALFVFIIILCAMGNNVFKNLFAKGAVCTDGDNAVYNAVACFIGAPLSIIGHGLSAVSSATLIISLFFGLSMAGVAITTIKALRTGPMSLTVLFGNFATLIPIFYGFIFWHEPVSFIKAAGIMLIFFSVFLIINPEKGVKVSRKWVLYAFLYFLTSGLMALFTLMQAKLCPESENPMFLFWGFLSASLWMLVYLFLCQRKPETRMTVKLLSKENLNGLLVGIFGGISHMCTMKALTLMDSTVFYPVKDGLCIIFNALLSHFLFKEFITKKQYAGLFFGLIAVIILTVW